MAALSSRAVIAILLSAFAVSALVSGAGAFNAVSNRRLLQSNPEPFPPNCDCDRHSSNSPYRLQMSNFTTAPGFLVYCFKVQDVGCDSGSKCCDGNQGIMKVEFNVEPACKGSVKRVSVNGAMYTAWEYNQALGTLRVTSLNRTADNATDTEVCLFMPETAACTNLNQLCYPAGTGACQYAIFNPDRDCCPVELVAPPPPPSFGPIVPAFAQPPLPPAPTPSAPPPAPAFPNCSCLREQEASRMTLSPVVTSTPYNNSWTKTCFTVAHKDSCNSDRCCQFALHKLEFAVKPTCAGSFIYATAGGERAGRVWQTRPYPAIKVTNIATPFEDTDGLEICIFLRPPCASLSALTSNADGTITVGLFNQPSGTVNNCCPIYNVGF